MKTINPQDRFKEDLSEQDIFDHAAHHLGTMKERCVDLSGTCLYRGPNGNQCAVGYFLKDSEVPHDLNAEGLRVLMERGLLPKRLMKHNRLLRTLQCIHDSSQNWGKQRNDMLEMLNGEARYRRLDNAVLSNPDYAWNRPHLETVIGKI